MKLNEPEAEISHAEFLEGCQACIATVWPTRSLKKESEPSIALDCKRISSSVVPHCEDKAT